MAEPVSLVSESDPAMARASERARATFKYFWRELSWEHRRIVPGLSLSAVKLAFRDLDAVPSQGLPEVEHMWVGEVGFDGREVTGTLLNSPNWLKSFKAGDRVLAPLEELGDWMYESQGRVYGGFTVDVVRATMAAAERDEHDSAWGLPFGQVGHVLVDRLADPEAEHPMSENMAPKYREQIASNRALLGYTDEDGWTLLHQMALAGSAANVQTLLELGADRAVKTPHGMTARELAASLGWTRVIALLDLIEPMPSR